MLAAQSLGAIPVPLYQDAAAAEFVFPIANAEIAFAVVEDQEQVDKLIEIRATCPQLARIWFDDPRGLRHYSEPGLASLDALVDAGRASCARPSGLLRRARSRKTRPDDVAAMFFTSGTTGNAKGVVHTHDTLIDRARAGARFDKLTDERRGARLPAAGVDRPEHLLVRAVAGLRLRRQLPRVGEHGDDRPARDRPDLLLRAAARLRGPAHERDDPHGGRGAAEALAVRPLHGAGAPRRPGADGRPAGRPRRPARATRSATCSSTRRCATRSASRACASPTPRARRSGPTCSSSTARSAST